MSETGADRTPAVCRVPRAERPGAPTGRHSQRGAEHPAYDNGPVTTHGTQGTTADGAAALTRPDGTTG